MISEEFFDQIPNAYAERLAAINSKYLQMIADRVGAIGRLSSSDIHRLDQLRRYGADYDEMISDLSMLTNKTASQIDSFIEAAAKNSYNDLEKIAAMKNQPLIPFAENIALQRSVRAVAEQTLGTFRNLSNTSVIGYSVRDLSGNVTFKGLGETYRATVDMAIQELSMGVTDFPSAMRGVLNSLADSGLRTVDYASGATRRLDSAVRMNILDGARDVYQGIQDQIGKEIGCDGVEISAHGGCAPDHLPYQGKQYSIKEFNHIQDSLERQIGKWNCRHVWNSIILGISRPAYSKQQLAELRRMSEDTIEFDGKEYTLYEATQLQRKIESAVRQSKDRANMAKAIGDHQTRVTEQLRINRLTQKYKELSNVARLPYKSERMSVSGFHPVKAIKSAPEYPQNILKFEKGIISQSYETVGLFTPDGKLIFKKDGSKNTVEFFGEEVGYMKGNILTHNHPSGSPFSDFDIFTFVQAQLREIRAAGKQYTYSFSYKKYDINKLYSLDDFMPVWREAITNTYNKFDPEKLPASEFNHQCLVELSHLTGWVYRRIPYHD